MALSKSLTYKGYDYSYWVIGAKEYEKKTNKTRFVLWWYKDKDARDENIENYIPDFSKTYETDGDITTAECYAIAKRSALYKNITKIFEPATTFVTKDENGEDIEQILEPEKPEEFEIIELNPLVNAQDI